MVIRRVSIREILVVAIAANPMKKCAAFTMGNGALSISLLQRVSFGISNALRRNIVSAT